MDPASELQRLKDRVAELEAEVRRQRAERGDTVRAQEGARPDELPLRSTLDHMLEGCQILGHDWRYRYINPAAERHNQRPKEELLGRTYMEMWPGIERTEVFARIERCLRERVAFHWENEFEFPDRSRGWFELRIEPVPEGVLILSADITARRAAEERLRDTLANLERSNRDLEQFAYVASHDLREPLRMVTTYTELLSRRHGDQLTPAAKEFLAYAAEGAHRMERLIADLLEVSRVGSRSGPTESIPTEKALDDALSRLRMPISETGAEIARSVLPPVRGHSGQIVQLFQNLVSNALKFRHPDRPPRVSVDAVPDPELAGYWRFRVRDNGIGIDTRHIPRLFVIFQRLHARQDYPGSGIGLALCKRIVEHHGGRVWIESEPGKGTDILFTLPGGTA